MVHLFGDLEEITVGLYDSGALQFSNFEFNLKSGRKSPIYYNQRNITSFSDKSELSLPRQRRIRKLAVLAYSAAIDEFTRVQGVQYDHLYGIPQSLTALGAMVAYRRSDSILWGRVGEKDYGQHATIEGNYTDDDNVLQLEDVATTAGSMLASAKDLKTQKLNTVGFVVMFDRQEGGQKALELAGYKMLAVQSLDKAIEILKDKKRIGIQEIEWVNLYHQQLRDDGLMLS